MTDCLDEILIDGSKIDHRNITREIYDALYGQVTGDVRPVQA
jgi:hypothetical protein